jgi:iron complex transport system permease protein
MTTAGDAPVVGRRAGGWARIRHQPVLVIAVLLAVLVVVAIGAATIGAAGIPLHRLLAAAGLGAGEPDLIARDRLVLWSIRLPRIAVAAMVGALLAAAGAIMQGLFRNPLADPALVGVSSGGALAATTTIVMGDRLGWPLPFELLPIAAFLGSLAATTALYRIATSESRTSAAIFLLGGLAIAALANAGIGLLIFIADDRQLRDVTFWLLGSLGGATWPKAIAIAPFPALLLIAMPLIVRGLDLLVLGEAEAFHMGVEVEKLKRRSIMLVSAMTGAAVAVAGVIGFVGIVVPHLLRLMVGPGHRLLLPASVFLGAILMIGADTGARVVAAPAEVPIGILTAAIGAPFFLAILLRQRSIASL